MLPREAFWAEWTPRVLGVVRIVVALLFLQHGLSKFFGFPGAAPATLLLFPHIIGGAIEVAGSLLLLVGLFTRVAALIMSGEMAVAYWMAHAPRSPYPISNGGESAIMFCFIFLYIGFAGVGAWSLDARRG